MSSNTKLPIDSLDFDNIKSNLKEYLSSQDAFKDYNFEGSGLNILLDVLAYNTHYQAFYNNMVVSEMFLDSAKRRDSINSIAKLLNYVPKSRSAAKVTVDLIFNGAAMPGINNVLPAESEFTATIGDQTFSFFTSAAHIFVPCEYATDGSPTKWIISDLELSEGQLTEMDYNYNAALACGQSFLIPHSDIDISTLKVSVVDDSDTDLTISDQWMTAENLVEVGPTCKVYWLNAGINNYYEVEFGDNIIGKEPLNKDRINLKYLRTKGAAANDIGKYDKPGARTFSLSTIGGQSPNQNGYEAIVKEPSNGGSEKETTCETKRYAPKSFQSQNRAVTEDDFKTLITREYPVLKSVLVWGGEKNNPPQYGKVFISGITDSGTKLSKDKQQEIINNILKDKLVVTLIPEFVDPDFTYLLLRTVVNFDKTKSTKTKFDIPTVVRQTVQNYTDDVLERFGNAFRYSTILNKIDKSDTGIISSSMSVFMQKRIDVTFTLKTSADHFVQFADAIKVDSSCDGANVTSNAFMHQGRKSYLEDNGKGLMQIYYVDGDQKTITKVNAGTVNYETGEVFLDNITIQSVPGDIYLRLQACSTSADITPENAQVLIIDEVDPDSHLISINEISTPADVC